MFLDYIGVQFALAIYRKKILFRGMKKHRISGANV